MKLKRPKQVMQLPHVVCKTRAQNWNKGVTQSLIFEIPTF